ncbi:hypothetical protein SELR_05660 [Selenomonas ruminantium subsp. lactilytica TAM6421]|uniref:Uncharacterized protein n=1 Tax=Selenomonas ruminantium subsp. lactilytica (strain NBRC 103574 / TAM6421) TaxID=927704 RepID=I0GND7_SELRL|nr:hypothetical protein [Selenomonas ruminantium]BAL82274.1 hypothetical protein SELR_05660 [Selenomonas ruminantium subsp. lactilytica TAM6421]
MAKLYLAAVFAFIAAVVIVITGLSSEARFSTVVIRSLIGFVSAGLIVYIVLRVLAARDIIDFDDFIEAKDEEALAELEGEASPAEESGEEQPVADEAETGATEQPVQFEPLSSEDLTRMETPE